MKRSLWFALLLAPILGCSQSPTGTHPVAKDPSGQSKEGITIVEGSKVDRASLVGQRVTLIGVQTRTKIPSLCGVDVDGPSDLADTKVTATGILQRHEVAPRGPDEPIVASRGPGVYYSLQSLEGGGLAKTSPYPPR